MNKVLVVYATKSGCTTDIAKKIGDTLAENGASVDVVPAEKAGGVAGYDAVVVGSGVRMGQWHSSARSWVTANADALKGLPVAFFTCNLTLAQEPEKVDEVRAYHRRAHRGQRSDPGRPRPVRRVVRAQEVLARRANGAQGDEVSTRRLPGLLGGGRVGAEAWHRSSASRRRAGQVSIERCRRGRRARTG